MSCRQGLHPPTLHDSLLPAALPRALPCCPAAAILLPCCSLLPAAALHFEQPLQMRGASCLLETHTYRRATGTGREDPQRDANETQLWFPVKCSCLCVELRKEANSKKANP